MHFTIDAQAFLQALHGINIRSRMHNLVLLEARWGKITVCAATKAHFSNCDAGPHLQATRMLIPISLEREGTYAAHYRQLVQALRAFTGTIEVRQEGSALMVSQKNEPHIHQTPIECEPPDTFPHHLFGERQEGTTYTKKKVERVQCHSCKEWHSDHVTETYQVVQVMTQRVLVKQEVLLAMLKQVIWASDEENFSRPSHAGICVNLLDNMLSFSATDGFCVAIRREQPGKTGNWSQSILVPAKLFAQALRLFPKQAEILMEAVLERHQFVKGTGEEKKDKEAFVQAVVVRLSTEEDIQVILSAMNAPVPPYCSVFSAGSKTRVVCEAADLLSAVEAVSPVEKDASAIWLHIQETGVRVEARREKLSASAIHDIAAQKTGQDISILLNCWYLTEMVRASTSPQVALECTEPDKPVVLRSCNDRDDYEYALMPMGPRRG